MNNDKHSEAVSKFEGGKRLAGLGVDSPLITIITVVYNGATYLDKTIKSVLSLGFEDLQLIVIDGGSNDATLDVLKQYDDVIDYWMSEKDDGIYDAMNKGWALAHKDSRILYLGAGDKTFNLPSADVLRLNEDILYGNVDVGGVWFRSRVDRRLYLGNTLHHQALLIPKRIHLDPPFDTAFKVYADYDFNLRLFRAGHRFRFDEAVVGYALPGGVSSKLDVREMSAVSRKNCGRWWALGSLLYCTYQLIRAALSSHFHRHLDV